MLNGGNMGFTCIDILHRHLGCNNIWAKIAMVHSKTMKIFRGMKEEMWVVKCQKVDHRNVIFPKVNTFNAE